MNFVGRQKEMALFLDLIKTKEPSLHLLYIHGPGGQGKTTLLKQFADCCREQDMPCLQVDCRYADAHPDSFRELFRQAAPFTEGDIIEQLATHHGNVVLLIDTYEKIKPLDDWLRQDFLPELPGNVITVICGRSPLSTNWRTDPGWQTITKSIALHELTHDESEQLLQRRSIPADKIKAVVNYTHGNPLALSIVADMFDQYSDPGFNPLSSPDIMKTLLEQFIQEVPSPAHKAALELFSLVNVGTEKLIEEVLGVQLAHELFNWITTLSFIEKGPAGIYLHEIARDTIAAELHWRNPEWYRHLHIRIQQYYVSRILKQSGENQRALLFGLIFLHRMNPAVKPFFEFQENGNSWQDMMKDDDRAYLIDTCKKFEGTASAGNLKKWLEHEAANVWVFRDAEKNPAGFILKISLDKIKAATHDPVINQLLTYKRSLNLDPGAHSVAFRSWMGRDHYQNVSGVQSAIFLAIVQYYFTPGLAISFLDCANPAFWAQMLNYADLHHLPNLDHELNGKLHGWYMHNWLERPPLAWLDLMGKREINEEEEIDSTTGTGQKGSLSETEFSEAVQQALKHFDNPKRMTGNPLLNCRVVINNNEMEPTEINLALSLADKLSTIISTLKDSPRDEALYRVLYRTYVNSAGSQEQTADLLHMSFSTYRRNLKKAVEKVADLLWVEEQRLG